MMQHHKYTLQDLENMMPWEKNLYVTMLLRHIEEENDRIREMQNKHRQRF